MFAFQDRRDTVDVSFTDRHGGVSGGPYSSLNLALASGDDEHAVEQNIDRATSAFAGGPASLARMHQVHGADVVVVSSEPDRESGSLPDSDGLVTTTPGVVLMVRVADCVPVLLADVEQRVVGAAHAGRPGMVRGVVSATVKAMRDLGAEQICAWLGPHVCGRCYEVPAGMRDEVVAQVPESLAETSWGTSALDIGAGVRAQLRSAGVDEITDVSRCTMEDEDLFSYRRQGPASGRFAGLVWLRP